MSAFLIHTAGYLGGITVAYLAGKGWRPRLPKMHVKMPRRSQPVPAPVTYGWEPAAEITAPIQVVVTDAKPPHRRSKRQRRLDAMMAEAETFVGDLHDETCPLDCSCRNREDSPVRQEPPRPAAAHDDGPGTTTINSIEDVLAWGERMQKELHEWQPGTQELPAITSGGGPATSLVAPRR